MSYVGTYKLDARPDRIDLRDRPYTPPLKSLEPEFPTPDQIKTFFPLYEAHHMILDQGTEGACTGFGLACTINYLLWRRELLQYGEEQPPPKVSPRMLYHLARFYDEWPGEDYEGSSCRGAIKAWHKHGVCTETLWPYRNERGRVRFVKPSDGWDSDAAQRPLGIYYRIDKNSVTDIQAAIQDVGAVYASSAVHTGWNLAPSRARTVTYDTLPLIPWDATITEQGRHAFALVGFCKKGFVVQNSWGANWGLKGFALLGYDDWVKNGTDAWVCVLGAPTQTRSKTHFLSSGSRERDLAKMNPAALSWFGKSDTDHDYQNPAVKPWDEEKAYQHSVVMGNDGKVINRLIVNEGPIDTVDEIVVERPSAWFEQKQPGAPKRIVLYAHGGLNSESSSINRIQVLAPYFEANGIYPIFFTWKTGTLETILAIIDDAVGRWFPRSEGIGDILRDARESVADAFDRTIEVASENLGVKAIWSQMTQNARESTMRGDHDRGGFLTVKALAKLKELHPELEIHLIGHSAGSILLGHLLDDFPRNQLQSASCTLYAAACTVDFANRHYAKATKNDILPKSNFHLHLLTDDRERDDSVGPYRKSLLYLVSRALEAWHKTPLLGLSNTFNASSVDPDENIWSPQTLSHVKTWQKYWDQQSISRLDDKNVITAAVWENGRIERTIEHIDAAHGSFDNDVEVVDETIRRICGVQRLQHPVENLRY